MPPSDPLNTGMASLGYNSMEPISELGTVSVIFAMQIGAIFLMLGAYVYSQVTGSMLAERIGTNLQ